MKSSFSLELKLEVRNEWMISYISVRKSKILSAFAIILCSIWWYVLSQEVAVNAEVMHFSKKWCTLLISPRMHWAEMETSAVYYPCASGHVCSLSSDTDRPLTVSSSSCVSVWTEQCLFTQRHRALNPLAPFCRFTLAGSFLPLQKHHFSVTWRQLVTLLAALEVKKRHCVSL